MPLHFNSIANDLPTDTFNWMIQDCIENAKEIQTYEEGRFMHCWKVLKDDLSGESIGELVLTFENEEGTMKLLDADITLCKDELVEVEFVMKHAESSDANEYYQVALTHESQRINIETVKRHAVDDELEGSTRKVALSAFPFSLDVYDDVDDLNKKLFPEGIKSKVKGLEGKVVGFADNYAGCSFNGEIFSMIIGKVKRFQDVRLTFDKSFDFVIAWLDTALGTLPAAMSREIFDLSQLEEGKTVAMNADIKADLLV